jgi:2-C-methyl-D-erythritol 4-phosphate cytidylyltransferase
MKKFAVITAGGSGSRMGSDLPKQFMLLNNKPVLWHTLKAFLAAFADLHFILVLPAAYMEAGADLLKELAITEQSVLVEGGSTRFYSVQKGLAKVTEESVVFVHDGVRCLISPELIIKCYHQTLETGSAIPAVASTESVRIIHNNAHQPVNRNDVRIIQTPQTFKSSILLPAFQQEYKESFTDEATVVESGGTVVFLIDGEYQNLKITRPVDLVIAATILKERSLG